MRDTKDIQALRQKLVELLRKEGSALQRATELSKAKAKPEDVALAMREAEQLLTERTRLTLEVRDLEWKARDGLGPAP